jgi:outer membrane lipoprotein-sorting protein
MTGHLMRKEMFRLSWQMTAILLLLPIFIPFTQVPLAAELTAQQIVAKADSIRSPESDFSVDVTINSVRSGEEGKVTKYEVFVKGTENTLIKTMYPPIEKGRSILMKGLDLWVYLPNIRRPVRISLQQRLVGEVSYGDIARVNFSGDYQAKIIREDTINENTYYVLELSAKDMRVTYNRAIYWVQKESFRPFKAEFYSISGKLLKLCRYEDYQLKLGELRPMRLILEDPLRKGKKSVLKYNNMKSEQIPDKWFTRHYLQKLVY